MAKRYYRCPTCDQVLDSHRFPESEPCPYCKQEEEAEAPKSSLTLRHEPKTLARFLTCNLQGLISTAKANPDRDKLNDIVRVVLASLD